MINSKSFPICLQASKYSHKKYIPANGEKNAHSSTTMDQYCGQSIDSQSLQYETCDWVVKSIVKAMPAELIHAINKLEKCIHPLT